MLRIAVAPVVVLLATAGPVAATRLSSTRLNVVCSGTTIMRGHGHGRCHGGSCARGGTEPVPRPAAVH